MIGVEAIRLRVGLAYVCLRLAHRDGRRAVTLMMLEQDLPA